MSVKKLKAIEYLPHTADVRMRLTALSKQDLFGKALEGMAYLIKKELCKSPERSNIKKKIEIRSSNITTLLIDFLNEILTLTHTCKAVFCTLHIQQLTDDKLLGEVSGIKVRSFDEDLKAVTYHEAQVEVNNSGQLQITIVFDI